LVQFNCTNKIPNLTGTLDLLFIKASSQDVKSKADSGFQTVSWLLISVINCMVAACTFHQAPQLHPKSNHDHKSNLPTITVPHHIDTTPCPEKKVPLYFCL